uniref:Uncharacterized protein n=1 Tax=Cannabis sativa TaxID=3483 RepID=A0A803PU00_CANSA
MNPRDFWGGDNRIDEDLLSHLFKDHPLTSSASSSSKGSSSSPSSEFEISSGSVEPKDGMPDTLPTSWATLSVSDLPTTETVVTIARHFKPAMARTKWTCHRAPPQDPHIVELMTRGRVRNVEEAEQPKVDKSGVVQVEEPAAEQPMADQDEETSTSHDNDFDAEQAMPATRPGAIGRQFKTCIMVLGNPLGSYDEAMRPVNSQDLPLVVEPRNLMRSRKEDLWEEFDVIDPLGIMPLHPYFKDIANFFKLCSTQITLKGIKYLSTLFVLYVELGWPTPSPYEVCQSIPSLQLRDRANHILSQPAKRCDILWLAIEANFWRYCLYPPAPGTEGIGGPSKGPGDTPMVEGASREKRHVPEQEKGSEDRILLGLLDHCLLPETNARLPNDNFYSNFVTFLLANMASKMRNMEGGPSSGTSSGRPQARMAQTARSSDVMLKLSHAHAKAKGSAAAHKKEQEANEAKLKAEGCSCQGAT